MDFFADDQIVYPERGDFLISEPYLPDPNFERTVIYLCEHDENGSFGFVLNKPTQTRPGDLVEELEGFASSVFVGGPVQQNTLHFLHRGSLGLEREKEILNGIFWGIDFDSLLDKIGNRTISATDVKFFVGYSGWSPGQLHDEIESKSWIVFKNVQHQLVFDVPHFHLWQSVLQQKGGKYRLISNYPLDPRLN